MNPNENDYLRIGTARDVKHFGERLLYRFFEMLPGMLSWGALGLAVFLSWKRPLWVSIFIILFALLWFLRTVYFSVHLRAGYKKMAQQEKTNWVEKLDALPPEKYSLHNLKTWQDIYHLVVIPMYAEPLEILRDTFKALAASDYPKDKMIVVLAAEARTRDQVQASIDTITKEYGTCFHKFLVTWHPAGIPGELAGKGSNETWAAKLAKKELIDLEQIPYERIVFSSFDADTHIFPRYFSCLTYHFLTAKKPLRTSFQPVPLFLNNVWQAPVFSRIISFSSTFWHTMNQGRPERLITFSSHSMSFKTLVEVGFKQTNVVSDDSRIFWQCFLQYRGDYHVQPLHYPISMDANVATSILRTGRNLYKQQRRWAYGVGDIAYFLFAFLKQRKEKKDPSKPHIPFKKKLSLGFELLEGHFSWATAGIMIFTLGWLPLWLGGDEFTQTLVSYNLPRLVGRIMTLAMLGIVTSYYFSAVLLPPKPPTASPFRYITFTLGWFLAPLLMILFISLPALDAQARWLLGRYSGFWPTDKIRKKEKRHHEIALRR